MKRILAIALVLATLAGAAIFTAGAMATEGAASCTPGHCIGMSVHGE